MKINKKALAVLLIFVFIIPQLGCQSNGSDGRFGNKASGYSGYSKTSYCLDTICTIAVYGMNDENGTLADMTEDELETTVLQLITDAFAEADRYEKMLSKTIEGSEIYQINHAQGQPVEVSDTTLEVIRIGMDYGELTGGLFDITIGKATDLWDFHDIDDDHETESDLPDEAELAEAVSHVDYRKIMIEGNTVTLVDPEMEIDLGGVAKGYIINRVCDYLQDAGVYSAVLDFGGDVVAMGSKTTSLLGGETGTFTVGITDPTSDSSQLLGYFTCEDKTVVTSGTYERYIVKDGVAYHHILDVETGYPADTDVLSVTIITDGGRCAEADCISTACLIMGVEKGMEFVRSLDGMEAVFMDNDGNVEVSSEDMDFVQY